MKLTITLLLEQSCANDYAIAPLSVIRAALNQMARQLGAEGVTNAPLRDLDGKLIGAYTIRESR